MVDQHETGRDGALVINNNQFRFTNVSYQINGEITDDQWSDSINPVKTHTSVDISGTIEWAGANLTPRQALLNADMTPKEGITLQINGAEERIRVRDLRFTSLGKDMPADDTTDNTVEWESGNARFPDRQ